MDWTVTAGDITQQQVEALLVPIGDGGALSPLATRLDSALGGRLATLLTEIDFKGKRNGVHTLHTLGQLPARLLVLVGTGTASPTDLDQCRQTAAVASRAARNAGASQLALAVPDELDGLAAGEAIAEGILLATYQDTRFKSKPSTRRLTGVTLVTDAARIEAVSQGTARGETVAAGVALARDLVNQPGAELWPDRMATIAATMAQTEGLVCAVYDERGLADLGAGALLSVGQGSDRPPRLIHLRYRPAGVEAGPPIALVGKGITFDTGGYSLKTAQGMETMKVDMGGAAAVLGAMQTIARLKPPVAVDGIIATAENMVSGRSMRPGDVLYSLSGKTIEVNNTDAEGRLVLADALTFAIRQGAIELIDLATLTGACMVALGSVAVGVMGNQQAIIDRLLAAATTAGERMWQLPLYEEYGEGLRSDIADMRNSGGRYAGAQIGASFLKEFAGETPWVHLDIAGPAWLDRDTPLIPKGPSGVGVRTLVRYVLDAASASH